MVCMAEKHQTVTSPDLLECSSERFVSTVNTRKHSSRMRTVCFPGSDVGEGGGGGVGSTQPPWMQTLLPSCRQTPPAPWIQTPHPLDADPPTPGCRPSTLDADPLHPGCRPPPPVMVPVMHAGKPTPPPWTDKHL